MLDREKAVKNVKEIMRRYVSGSMSMNETAVLITSLFFQEIDRLQEDLNELDGVAGWIR